MELSQKSETMRFFILSKQRSGSTWLRSLLNGHAGIAAYSEIFLPYPPREKMAWVAEGDPRRFVERRPDLGAPRPAALYRYLDEVEAHSPDALASGFKIMMSEVRVMPEILPILALKRYRLIVLSRENYFEAVVSEMVSKMTDEPHGTSDGTTIAGLALDPAQVVRRMAVRQRTLRAMHMIAKLWPLPSMTVAYEDLVGDQQAQIARILALLQLDPDPARIESPLKKRVQTPYRELISNFDDVRDALVKSGYGRFIDSVA